MKSDGDGEADSEASHVQPRMSQPIGGGREHAGAENKVSPIMRRPFLELYTLMREGWCVVVGV